MLMCSGLGVVLFMSAIISFSLKRKHLLLMLLSLELMVLSIFLLMFVYMSFSSSEYFFSMIYLTFSVCEGVMGLSILVMMIRTHGNDYFQSFNVLW
uniref:NADH-ubiquinone oxidoreductase chain 4L n=1 Tax=Tenebrionoidea sp. 4 KM-2017 TaxID=2219482 RepID=A0A346RJI0_9CUCU|nr:NADH dehydrogenase subunit 4L [Tenebrionoidea sp. 4 KM-2017]